MTTRPRLTIAQTIAQFDTSRSTIRRGIDTGRFPHASKDAQGCWAIPIDDLIAARIPPRKTWLTESGQPGARERAHKGGHPAHDERAHTLNEHAHELAHRDARIAQLEAQIQAQERLLSAAERNADDLRTALRMIEASPAQTQAPVSPAQSRRHWWRRSSQKSGLS